MAKTYLNVNTRTIKLNTHKAEMAQPTGDRTYKTKREALKARDELLGQEKGSI